MGHGRFFRLLALALGLFGLAYWYWYGRKSEGQFLPSGSPVAESIRFEYAVYFLPAPSSDPEAVLRRVVNERKLNLKLVSKLPESPSEMVLSSHLNNEVAREYAPPDVESLQYSGRGLSKTQAEALQKSEQALILDFAHPSSLGRKALAEANQLVEAVAVETKGLIWDEETRETFTPQEWKKRRLSAWSDGFPDVSRHITIHVYESGEYVRAITLGMAKFGLPDVVVEDASWSVDDQVASLINLLCQALAEGAKIGGRGELDLQIANIRNLQVRTRELESVKQGGLGLAKLRLRPGKWEEGDPDNRLCLITAERYLANDRHARQEKMLTSLFGSQDAVSYITHTDELRAASNRAKAKLPSLQKAFQTGLEPGEYILVKAPFETPKGTNEWMWVEITSWSGNRIKGLLRNDPFEIPDLQSGQVVEVRQEDVFDYIRRHVDGSEEGNETGPIIEAMQKATGK